MKHYRYKCLTEDIYRTEWRSESDGPPTSCIVSGEHTIDKDSISITETMNETVQDVQIHRGSLIDPKNAKSRYRGVEIPVIAGDTVSKIAIAFPYSVDLIQGQCIYGSKQWGDKMSVRSYASGKPVHGIVAAEVEAGGSVVQVFPGLPQDQNLVGLFARFGSVEGQDELHEIIAADVEAGTITLTSNLVSGLSLNEEVRFWSQLIQDWWIAPNEPTIVGHEIFYASGLPFGYVLEVCYFHNSPAPQDGSVLVNLVYRF